MRDRRVHRDGLAGVDEQDHERELAVRRQPCPVCGQPAGAPCRQDHRQSRGYAHTGRYLAAADAGLVPALPGGGS